MEWIHGKRHRVELTDGLLEIAQTGHVESTDVYTNKKISDTNPGCTHARDVLPE